MNREEKWNDFISTGKVEDYLAYRNANRAEGTGKFQDSTGDGEKKDNRNAELSNSDGNGN